MQQIYTYMYFKTKTRERGNEVGLKRCKKVMK